jgi:hypothetical protein
VNGDGKPFLHVYQAMDYFDEISSSQTEHKQIETTEL